MLEALTSEGDLRGPTIGGERVARCPECGEDVTAVLPIAGAVAHWRHRPGSDCVMAQPNPAPESQWHMRAKAWFLGQGFSVEVPVGNRRADIHHLATGRTVEVQVSPITPGDAVQRTLDLGGNDAVVWLTPYLRAAGVGLDPLSVWTAVPSDRRRLADWLRGDLATWGVRPPRFGPLWWCEVCGGRHPIPAARYCAEA